MDSTGKTSHSQSGSGGETPPEPRQDFKADQTQVTSAINQAPTNKQVFFHKGVAANDEQAVQTNVDGGTIPLQVNVRLPQLELNLTPEGLPPIQINLNLPPLQVNVTLPAPVFPLPLGGLAPARVEIAGGLSIQAITDATEETPEPLKVATELGDDFLTKPWPKSEKIEAATTAKPTPNVAAEQSAATATVVQEPSLTVAGPKTATEDIAHPAPFEVNLEIQTFTPEAPIAGESALDNPSLPLDNLADNAARIEPKNIEPASEPISDKPLPPPSVHQGFLIPGPSTSDLIGPGGLFHRISTLPPMTATAPDSRPGAIGPPTTSIVGPIGLFTKIFGGLKPMETAVPTNAENASPQPDLKLNWNEEVSDTPTMAEAPADMGEALVSSPPLEISLADIEHPQTEPDDLSLDLFIEEELSAPPQANEIQLSTPEMAIFNDGLPGESELVDADLNPRLEDIDLELSTAEDLIAKFAPTEAAYSNRPETVLPAQDVPKEISEFEALAEPVDLLVDLEPIAEEAEAPLSATDENRSSEFQALKTGSIYRTPKAPPHLAAKPFPVITPELPPQSLAEAGTPPKPTPQQADSAKPAPGQNALEITTLDWPDSEAKASQAVARPLAQPPAGQFAAAQPGVAQFVAGQPIVSPPTTDQPTARQVAASQPLEFHPEPAPLERIPQVQAGVPTAPATTVATVESIAPIVDFPEKTEAALEASLDDPQTSEELFDIDQDLVFLEKEADWEAHPEAMPEPGAAALPLEVQPEQFFDVPLEIPTLKDEAQLPPPGTAGPPPLAPLPGLTPDDQARQAYQAVLAAMPPPEPDQGTRQPPPVQAIPADSQPTEPAPPGQIQAVDATPRPGPADIAHQDFDFDLDTSDLDLDMSSLDF